MLSNAKVGFTLRRDASIHLVFDHHAPSCEESFVRSFINSSLGVDSFPLMTN